MIVVADPTIAQEISLMKDTIAQVAQAMQKVLTDDADRLAREVKFVRRQRKLSGSSFVQTLVFGCMSSPMTSYTDLAQSAAMVGTEISAQGLEQRFTEEAAQLLERVLAHAVEQVVFSDPAATPILERFQGMYIRDSSIVELPAELMFSRPGLCIFHAWSLFAIGQPGAAEQSLAVAEQALEPGDGRAIETAQTQRDQLPGSDRMKLRGRAAATRDFLAFYRGDVPAIIRYSRLALEYLPQQDLAWRSAATNVLGDAYDFKGEMAAAYQARLEALEVSEAAGNSYQVMIANLKLAIILRRQGRL